jgi:preprotein translocase subunit SecF
VSWWTGITRGSSEIDFVGRRRRWLILSAILLGISLLGLTVRGGLNLGLEFRGGLAVVAPNPAGAEVGDVRSAAAGAGVGEVRIQMVGGGEVVRIQTAALDEETERQFIEAMSAVTGAPDHEISLEAVGPTFGGLVARRALLALGVFLGAAVLFITWRLEWKMALAGLAALGHDLMLTIGVYAVTGFEVTPATVVATLTILGYSLYDTVVVFDRVGEMVIEEDRLPYSDLVNKSMNLVLSRSLITSLTSLLPVGSILFVGAFVFGATSLRDFALALFVGIAAGTYSSLFIAAPLLAWWKEGEAEWISRRRRLEDRPMVRPTPEPVPSSEPLTDAPARPPGSGARPRPPKRRRR